MTKLYSYTVALDTDMIDAFCVLQKGFTDQFVYYDKQRPCRLMGLGRCIALSSLGEADFVCQGLPEYAPLFFSFNRFDAENPRPTDSMMAAFPRLRLMLPEVVLFECSEGAFLQVNSLGPVYEGRVERFLKHARNASPRVHRAISYELEPDSFDAWNQAMSVGLERIYAGRIEKIVPSRRMRVQAKTPFSSKDLLINLLDGDARGTVFLYRYGDVFFCGCTPELLVRKQGSHVESMCLAGTCLAGTTPEERTRSAQALLADNKNRREHDYVVRFIREVFARNCYNVDIPSEPEIRTFRYVHHLCTPVSACVMEGCSLLSLASQLHPTPALSGAPVGEALMTLRDIEPYNRGFFGGPVGYVDGRGDGEFSVAIRSGVFDGEQGWIYAGCGVVEGSDARSEFDEINAKFKTILGAFTLPATSDSALETANSVSCFGSPQTNKEA